MKRDLNLMRNILFEIENSTELWVDFTCGEPEKENKLLLHLRLLEDIKCIILKGSFARLTFKGYDILELIRDNAKLNIQPLIKSGVSWEFLKDLIIAEAMKEKTGFISILQRM